MATNDKVKKINLVSFPHDLQSILKEICLICMRQPCLEVPWHRQHKLKKALWLFWRVQRHCPSRVEILSTDTLSNERIYGYYRLKIIWQLIICTTKSISLCSGLVLWLCTHIALACHICLYWRLSLCLLMPVIKHFIPREAFRRRITISFSIIKCPHLFPGSLKQSWYRSTCLWKRH